MLPRSCQACLLGYAGTIDRAGIFQKRAAIIDFKTVAVCKGFLIAREHLDKRLMALVRETLLSPDAARKFEGYFREAVQARTGNAGSEIKTHEQRLKALDSEINKLVDAIASVGISESLAVRLKSLEQESSSIKAGLASLKGAATHQIPNIQQMFKELLLRLNAEVTENAFAAKPILQGIFGPIQLELRGEEEVWAKIDTAQVLEYAIEPYLNLVAGAGFEPTTFGL